MFTIVGEGWRSTLELSYAAKMDVLACSLFASSGSDSPVTAEGVGKVEHVEPQVVRPLSSEARQGKARPRRCELCSREVSEHSTSQ
jgi:hypothetical protein